MYQAVPDLLDREDPVGLHGLRIRVKRLRYTLEVLGEAFLRPPEAELHHLKDLQTALGEHHDRIMLEALLQELYEGLAGRNRKTLALGTLEVLAYVGEARLNAFDRFRTLAAGMRPAEAGDALRRGLGLPGEPLP